MEIYTQDGELLRNAAVTYMVPVGVFLITFIAAYLLGAGQGVAAVAAVIGFVLAILGVIRYDRHVAKKNVLPVVRRILTK